jgi:hypothetical protein
MPAAQIRNRTVGCKMSDGEYERPAAVAEQDGMTLGEWVREVLWEEGCAASEQFTGLRQENQMECRGSYRKQGV